MTLMDVWIQVAWSLAFQHQTLGKEQTKYMFGLFFFKKND